MDWKDKMSGSGNGSGKGKGRKKKQPPRRGMGVAQLERIRTQQQQQQQQDLYWKLPLPHDLNPAAGELSSFPNVCCCAHRNYSDLNAFPFARLKKKRVNGEEIFQILQGEGEGAKVLAVHQRGGKGADCKLVMEYGFFPASSSAADASCAPGDPSTSIDLSLRL